MQVFLDEVYLNETALSLSDPSMYSFYQLLRVLRMYILPIVCGIGFVLQLWVILVCCYPRGPMRKCSLQPYLVSLAISDVVFLSMVMLDWVKTTDANLDYYSRKGFCQGMTYISSLCVFASGWYSCCILLDRYLYLCTSPATAKYLSTPLKAKFMCVSILAIGVVVYLNISLLYTVYVIDYITFLKPRCMSIVEYETVIEYFNKVELSLNLGVPYLCIVVLLLLITVQHCTSQCSQQCNGRKSPVETEVGEVRLRSNNGRTVSSHGKHSNNCKPRQNMDVESPNFAALSIATGVTFIILTFPAYVMRVIRTVYSEPEHVRKMTLLILLIDQLLQFVFYSRFAFNGLIYFISESSFRKSAAKMLSYLLRCRIFLRKSQDKSNVVNMEERESPTKTGLLKDGNPKIGSSE